MDKWFHSTLNWTCDYLFELGFELSHLSRSGVFRHVMFIFQIMAHWLLCVCWVSATVFITGAGNIHIASFLFNFPHMIMWGISCITCTRSCVLLVVVVISSNVHGFIRGIFIRIFQSCFAGIGAAVYLLAFWCWDKMIADDILKWFFLMKMPLIWHLTDFSAMVQSTIVRFQILKSKFIVVFN